MASFLMMNNAQNEPVLRTITYTIHDKGLSTTIDWHDRDVYGKASRQDKKPKFIVCGSGSGASGFQMQPNET
jgi:transcription initiation factor TFIIIB Brf1 subunit/transcription initiation factor TFIIB